jgi:hypothetical protein
MDVPAPTTVPDEPALKPPVAPSQWIEIDRRTFLRGTSATAVLLAASAIARTAGAAAPVRAPVPVPKPRRGEPWDDGTLWDDGTGWIP